VFTGGAAERAHNNNIKEKVNHPAVNLSGKTGLGEVAAILKKSALLVTNDTGIAHLSAAIGAKSIIIYAKKGSNIERWAPLDRQRHSIITPQKAQTIEPVLEMIESKLREKKLQGANVNYEHARAI
ncbi:MAG TPA: glycosyltransferase family 9 protein, partial [Balneolaceae bacterium]|nr:glycosyltransferase family 9 protein [Balneolaceae bacterium]